LEHQTDLAVVLDELHHVGHRLAALAAIVIEELDQADIATGIADHVGHWRPEDGVGVLRDRLLLLRFLLRRLAFVALVGRLAQTLGVLGEVFAPGLPDPDPVRRRGAERSVGQDEIARGCRRCYGHGCSYGHVEEDFVAGHALLLRGWLSWS